jgi:hypothetical protein
METVVRRVRRVGVEEPNVEVKTDGGQKSDKSSDSQMESRRKRETGLTNDVVPLKFICGIILHRRHGFSA